MTGSSARAIFRVRLDGEDLTSRFAPRLVSLSLVEKRGGEADQLDLIIDDSDGRVAIPPTGAMLEVALGWQRGQGVALGLVDKGTFKVDEAEHSGPPDIITIRARSADLTSSFRRRQERSFNDTTLGGVARRIAADHGWTPQIAPELAEIPVEVIAQDGQSDMALLRRLGRDHDAVATVKAGRLILSPIGRKSSAGGAPFDQVTIARTGTTTHSYRGVDRDQGSGVSATWHDQASAARHTVTVGTKAGSQPRRLGRVYNSIDDARTAAKAEHAKALRREWELSLDLALGRPDLFPELPVKAVGFKDEIDARAWLIAEATHSLDQGGGLATKLRLETAGSAA